MNNFRKDRAFIKADRVDDQDCPTCGLHTSPVQSEKPSVFRFETKRSFCLIKQHIAHLHKKILDIEENENAKPRFTLSDDNEYFSSEMFEELKQNHKKCLKKDFFDNERNEKKLPNMKPMDEVEFVDIETTEELQFMLDKLSNCREIAVNLEYYSRSSYFGFTWLLQISNEDTYYMINCLKLQKKMHILNTVFMDNKITKIFHDGENAVFRLYKDFGILVKNMFDTEPLKKNSKEEDLSQKNIILETNQIHTHCLIFLKNYYLIKLQQTPFKTMRKSCFEICKRVHQRADHNKSKLKELFTDKTTNRERYIARKLLEWRDGIAREIDEDPDYILHDIVRIARELLCSNTTTLHHYEALLKERFSIEEQACFNIDEIVSEAKKISNNGKNRQDYLNKKTKQSIEIKCNSAQVEENNRIFEVISNQDKKNIEKKKKSKQLKKVFKKA